MWILWMTSLSYHSTNVSASVSELSRLVTHTAVSSPKCNSEKRPLSNSVAFQTLFKWHRYCGILKIHIVRKINTGIRYEPVYRPALIYTQANFGFGRALMPSYLEIHPPKAAFFSFRIQSRCVRLEAALLRMVSVWYQSTARAIREQTDHYAFESLSRYFDVIHWSFCTAPLKVEHTYCLLFFPHSVIFPHSSQWASRKVETRIRFL